MANHLQLSLEKTWERIMKNGLLVIVSLFIASCNSMKGDLSVHEQIILLKKKSIFSSKLKNVKIPTGNYKAKLKASSKEKVKLTIKDVDGKKITIPFMIPKGTEVPSYQGHLVLSSEQTKQPLDLSIDVKTDSSSHTYSSNESCVQGYEYETECSWIPASRSCHTEGGHEVCRTKPSGEEICYTTSEREVCESTPGHNECREIQIPIYGSQDVTYQSTTTTKNVIIELLKDETIKAQFDHTDSDTSRHAISSGPCY